MFWENFWANLLSNIAVTIILSLLGIVGYKLFIKNKIIINVKQEQKNKFGDNIQYLGSPVDNSTIKSGKEITKKLTKQK
jgi:hypothetical protein